MSEPKPVATPDEQPEQPEQPEVVSPDGVTAESDEEKEPTEEIESPGKIIRIGSMVKQLLEEVRNTQLDEAARDHLRDIYENSLAELRAAVSPDLAEELGRLTLPFDEESVPTEAQLRVAQAQLVGWLEGLFHGIQATLVAQQLAARQQLEGMRGQLGPGGPGMVPGAPAPDGTHGPGGGYL
jgi:hypothetical protein